MSTLTRRQFIGGTALGTAAAVAARFPSLAQSNGPVLRLGLIGCGGYGRTDLRKAFQAGGVDLVAVCDVDSAHAKQVAEDAEKQQGHRPREFKHYQELLDQTELDILILATPAHWRNLVQIGFQRRSSDTFKQAREFIRRGGAGRIVCVDAQINWPLRMGNPTPTDPPATLDWDLWCGPSPLLPYSEQVGHKLWRYEKHTGNGHLVDWGIHLVDVTRWFLDAGSPTAVSASGGIFVLNDVITTPDVMTAQFLFGGVPLTWKHRIWGAAEAEPDSAYATIFFGDEATVLVKEDRWEVIPRKQGADRIVHEVKCDAQLAHMQDFLDAVRQRRPPACLIEDAHHSTTAVNLAMLAYAWGGSVQWDPAREQVLNNDVAAARLLRPYRAPWKHPYPYAG